MARGKFLIVGGAGFIGSHFVDRLLGDSSTERVTVYDNFSSGRQWHLAAHEDDRRLNVIHGEVHALEHLRAATEGHDTVIHLASNPEIARAIDEPTIDFDQGTVLTNNVVEAMRVTGAKTILYASGSGVYGDLGELEVEENHGPLIPISTYAASKLAGEAIIAAYGALFGFRACVFRFGNVVGPRQTHGVGFDFARRLRHEPQRLEILGDGSQSKSYVHVEDVVSAVLMAYERSDRPFAVFNVATGDYITVREIADIAVRCLGLSPSDVAFEYSGGDRGWRGDVPIVRLATDRIRDLGWSCGRTSAEAIEAAIRSMLEDADRVFG